MSESTAPGIAVRSRWYGFSQRVIPEGAGAVKATDVGRGDRFGLLPAWVRTYAEEGSESRLDRRSTRVAGLALTPAPIGAEFRVPRMGVGLWVGRGGSQLAASPGEASTCGNATVGSVIDRGTPVLSAASGTCWARRVLRR